MYDNLIVEPITGHEEVDGLVLPQQAEQKPQLGKVLVVGDGRLLENGVTVPMRVKVGATILFNQYSTTSFMVKDVEYLILREEDIIGIL